MLKRILVPLDGSNRAERAIPVAARLARDSGGSIIFLRVATSRIDAAWYAMESPLMMQEFFDADRARSIDYLARIAKSNDLAGVETKTEVLFGMPAQAILSVAEANDVDLITLCSHGDTGFKRWALGSVAQKVARHSPVPVLILHERGGVSTTFHPGGARPVRVLVPLDGSSLAEAALTPAAQLSAALSAPAQGGLHLARVVRLPSMDEYGQNDRLAEAKKQGTLDAKAYLSTVKQRVQEDELASLNLQVTSSVVVNTDVASMLIGIAEVDEDMKGFKACDVIAMATHGRGGPERWVMGSVTERVLGATKLPLLIVRPQKTEAKPGEAGETTETVGTGIASQSWVGLM